MAEVAQLSIDTEQVQNATEIVKAEQARNRQINFFIMRFMWQAIRGRSRKNSASETFAKDIFGTLGICRERYTRVIDHGTIRYAKSADENEPADLYTLTGLAEEIFTGTTRIEVPAIRSDEGAQDTTIAITPQDWDTLFDLRKQRRIAKKQVHTEQAAEEEQFEQCPEDYQQVQEKYIAAEQKICAILKKARRTDTSYPNFYRLCYFLNKEKAAPIKLLDSNVQRAIQSLDAITFELLNKCTSEQLGAIQKRLNDSLKLTQAIITYKKASKALK